MRPSINARSDLNMNDINWVMIQINICNPLIYIKPINVQVAIMAKFRSIIEDESYGKIIYLRNN